MSKLRVVPNPVTPLLFEIVFLKLTEATPKGKLLSKQTL